MGFKCGLIGLPNVGKSTLFNTLTNMNASALNFPFCTIKPNIGIVPVIDERLNMIKNIVHPNTTIPAKMTLIDIAGLVKGASEGEGLGNQFLSNIRETDVIIHVIRCFKDDKIIHIYSKVNPINDVEIVETELILSDIDRCQKIISKLKKQNSKLNKKIIETKHLLNSCLTYLNQSKMLNSINFDEIELKILSTYNFLTLKPFIYVANIDESKNQKKFLDSSSLLKNKKIIPICLTQKKDLNSSPLIKNKNEKIKKNFENLKKIIKCGYDLLNLETFFTVGEKEVKAWTINKNSYAPTAAGKIHSDFEKGFIRAKVISYADFIFYKGEVQAKKFGKCRLEGKKYIVEDGDIIQFLFNN
ncbi:redox-regulated ATPase YchF [Buchnera aphidicola]|uniref:Ribosome-binding ATPase YchF n=1 Tax=Buchnera aphidicola (Anoecia oenotherae) TaxID=1241833 RepID=A0A4D6XXV4_9GAMM|nr:redox-regulated ATPase YchF [Buchnera aphidicola]QCI19288.1 redox-regulated ATPase YchF [Buchnera aphidicola (Anoecia oenotherae)]